ncbi:MAG: YdeI/OmpD-associated family protein [Planctomycetota bacterium]|nr:YdeI/OmpD-associated family protein [Planctomycetota bacterium]
MTKKDTKSKFQAKLQRPAKPGSEAPLAFVVLPKDASAKLPRRGRTTIEGTINGHAFQATLDPDGQKSHWLAIDEELLDGAGADLGDTAAFEIRSVDKEPEPEVPADLAKALAAWPEAKATWDDTTTLARLDWIHWVTSAKQQKTRTKRVGDACDMLASGSRRVCCFDSSGFFSKGLSAPKAAE